MVPEVKAAWIQAIGSVVAALVAIVGIAITILSSFKTWSQTERSKRIDEEINWKKERYAALLKSSKGFYSPTDQQLISEFLTQYSLCWMYCPDELIHRINSFLDLVNSENEKKPSAHELETSLVTIALEMRKDLLKREPLAETGLEVKDFRDVRPNQPQSK